MREFFHLSAIFFSLSSAHPGFTSMLTEGPYPGRQDRGMVEVTYSALFLHGLLSIQYPRLSGFSPCRPLFPQLRDGVPPRPFSNPAQPVISPCFFFFKSSPSINFPLHVSHFKGSFSQRPPNFLRDPLPDSSRDLGFSVNPP